MTRREKMETATFKTQNTNNSNTANMPGQKRDFRGKAKPNEGPKVRNEFTAMFETFRDELDQHHDRRERIIKASRDITALSKKIIFSLQRVRQIQPDLPDHIEKETKSRLAEISRLLATMAPDVQGINRYRYSYNMFCLDELLEALTFAHYLRTQTLLSYDHAVQEVEALSHCFQDKMDVDVDASNPLPPLPAAAHDASATGHPTVLITERNYLDGVFDLSGEMMRFATVTTALSGKMATAEGQNDQPEQRTIVRDMQELASFFETLPQQFDKTYRIKMSTLRQSVLKVEKLGYGLTVRGSERPAGWMPDTSDEVPVAED